MHKNTMVSVSPLAVRKVLWTMPVLRQSYKKLLGLSAQARSNQMLALREIANCVTELLIVLATGGGKILLYVLHSLFPITYVTAVIIPLIALKQDLLRRCLKWQIEAMCYNRSTCTPNRLHATPSLLFINVDSAVTDHCRAFFACTAGEWPLGLYCFRQSPSNPDSWSLQRTTVFVKIPTHPTLSFYLFNCHSSSLC